MGGNAERRIGHAFRLALAAGTVAFGTGLVSNVKPTEVSLPPPLSTPITAGTEGIITSKQAMARYVTPLPTGGPEPTPVSTVTAAAIPTPLSAPSFPERLGFQKEDLLKEMILPNLIAEAAKTRAERAKQDPEYSSRIDLALNKGRINFALLGTGKEQGKPVDFVMVLSYNENTHTAYYISFPRDLQSPEVFRVTNSRKDSRINLAWAHSRPPWGDHPQGEFGLVREVLENATGLSIDFPIKFDFQTAMALIDETVGYVEIDVKYEIYDPSYPALEGSGYAALEIPAGLQKLNGYYAVAYARSRQGVERDEKGNFIRRGSDYIRQSHQQEVVEAYFNRLTQEIRQNPLKLLTTVLAIRSVLGKQADSGSLRAGFDMQNMLLSLLGEMAVRTPEIAVQQLFGGWTVDPPSVKRFNIDQSQVVGAGIPGQSIVRLRNSDPYADNPRQNYWGKLRELVARFVTEEE